MNSNLLPKKCTNLVVLQKITAISAENSTPAINIRMQVNSFLDSSRILQNQHAYKYMGALGRKGHLPMSELFLPVTN